MADKEKDMKVLHDFITDFENDVERLAWITKFIKFHGDEKDIVKDAMKILKKYLKKISETDTKKETGELIKIKKVIKEYKSLK